MSHEIQRYIARAIVHHLDGDMDKFEHYLKLALEEYDKYKHLHVSIGDILKAKGA